MALYHMEMNDIHVLLVDHDLESQNNITTLIKLCGYKVTLAQHASTAITMLLSEKKRFDIVMANIDSAPLDGFRLLQQAVNMDIPTILMSAEDNKSIARNAIEKGAFLCITKPRTTEMLKYLWQHVMREKMRGMGKCDTLVATDHSVQDDFGKMIRNGEGHPTSNMFVSKEKDIPEKIIRERKQTNGEKECNMENHTMVKNKIKKKDGAIDWTHELHERFMDAIAELGEGGCFPKDIHKLMNVPGVTKAQVARHLEKCRSGRWQSPKDNSRPRKRRGFGLKPQLGRAPSYHVHVPDPSGPCQSFGTKMPNDGGIENIMPQPVVMTTSHQYPHPSNATPCINSSNPWQASNDLFGVPEMDNVIQDFSDFQQTSNALRCINSSNPPGHSSNDLFGVPEMDSLVQNFSGFQQGSTSMMDPKLSSRGNLFDIVYHGQNSMLPNNTTPDIGLPCDDFFVSQDMDSLIQNLSGTLQQESAWMHNLSSVSDGDIFDPFSNISTEQISSNVVPAGMKSNPMQQFDESLSSQDQIGSLIQNFSDLPQGSAWMNNPSSGGMW